MLTDRFPELEKLDPQEKLILAGELWREATRSGHQSPAPDLHESAVAQIEKRLDAYLADPDSGIRWEELLKQIPSGKDH